MSCAIHNTYCNGSIRNYVFGWSRPSQMPVPLPCSLCDCHIQRVTDRYGSIRPLVSGATLDDARETLIRLLDEELRIDDEFDETKEDMCATCINDATCLCRHGEKRVCHTCWSYHTMCCNL